MTTKNPWLGLASYEEPKNDGTDYQFCGRDEETIEMVRLIDNNLFITLYGSSGIGKTSLLRAGVIPILRRKDYFPLYVRLSQEPKEIPYAEAIVRKLQSCGLRVEKGAEVKHPDAGDRLYLWEYFATTRFLSEGCEVYPVIILDQFEEVFRESDKAKAELLLRQIYLLQNDELEMPDEAGWSADTNYRFVASIREDFLFVLEDSIDENSLDLYKNNRYRLRPMKPEQARQVVLVPGKDCIEETEKEIVTERIIGLAKRPQSNDIDTLLLSLVCSGTYDKKSGERIAPADLAVWKDNPMEVYYQDAVKGLKVDQVRYIQQHFTREDGSRRRVNASEVRSVFGETTYRELTQGKNRLFAIGDKGQMELLHDQLGMAVYKERKAYEERELKKKQRQRTVLISLIVLALASLSFFLYQNNKLKKANWKMIENRTRFVAEKASQLVDEGNPYWASRLALEVLPANIEKPDKPYVPEAECALRKAWQKNTGILRGHTASVYSASFSSDGKRIVSASDDRTVRIWDAETGRQIVVLEGDTVFRSASFSPDGKRIVSASDDGNIGIWDAETGTQTKVLKDPKAFLNSVSFSLDGKRIVLASDDGYILICDAETGRTTSVLKWDTVSVRSASFSPDGKRIVSTSCDNTVRIWNVETRMQKVALKHTTHVRSTSFSPDGKRIVLASDDGTVMICDAEMGTGTQTKILEGHTKEVYSASFSPDGKFIVSASLDKTVRIWDVETGKKKDVLKHTTPVRSASFSPDSKRIVSASDDETIRIWDVQTKKQTKDLEGHTDEVFSASFSPDGKRIVSASWDNTVRIWDAETGKQIGMPLIGHTASVWSASFRSDSKRIVSASSDKTVRIWDAETGKQIGKPLIGHTFSVRSASFSPDGKHIVSASDDGSIRIWDAETGKQIGKPLIGHTASVRSASFSPDGKCIISASSDNTVRIWNAATGSQIGVLEEHTAPVRSASFSPDSKRIVSASLDNTVRIWDTEMGTQIGVLEGHAASVMSASFSPDGRRIVSASWDNTVRIWDAEMGSQIGILEGHTGVYSASFSPDGRHIVSASHDKTVRIWEFPSLQQLINETRERFKNRKLTPEERRKYYLE